MINKQKKIILIISAIIAIIIIAVVVIFLMSRPDTGSVAPFPPTGEVTKEIKTPSTSSQLPHPEMLDVKDVKEVSEFDKQKAGLEAFAKSFVERWGSYSTDGDYENFALLKSQMTKEMQQYTNDYVAKLKEKHKNAMFYGATTKVLNCVIEDNISDTAAAAKVSFQTEEVRGDKIYVYYGEMEVEMKKEGEKWLVDKIFNN